jgi:hypothetical protein
MVTSKHNRHRSNTLLTPHSNGKMLNVSAYLRVMYTVYIYHNTSVSSTNKTDRHDITESGVKHHNPNPIRHNSVDSISPSRTRAADSPQCCRLVLHKTHSTTRLYLHISKCVAVIHIKCTDCTGSCKSNYHTGIRSRSRSPPLLKNFDIYHIIFLLLWFPPQIKLTATI